MKRILITRPEPGASQTADRLRAMGFCPVLAPLLTIEALPILVPHSVAATLVTSSSAILSCPPELHQRPLFAVGSATAARAVRAGFQRVYDANGDAEALASLVATSLSPGVGSLLLPTTHGQGRALAGTLRAAGFRVVRRVAYSVAGVSALPEPARQALQAQDLSAAMFFSAETARHFVSLLSAAGLIETINNMDAVSISERAAVALRHLPWRRIHVAVEPNQEAMLALLQ